MKWCSQSIHVCNAKIHAEHNPHHSQMKYMWIGTLCSYVAVRTFALRRSFFFLNTIQSEESFIYAVKKVLQIFEVNPNKINRKFLIKKSSNYSNCLRKISIYFDKIVQTILNEKNIPISYIKRTEKNAKQTKNKRWT